MSVLLLLLGALGNPANVPCLVRYASPESTCAGAQEPASPTDDPVTVLWRLCTCHEPAVVDKLSFHNKSTALVALAHLNCRFTPVWNWSSFSFSVSAGTALTGNYSYSYCSLYSIFSCGFARVYFGLVVELDL